MNKFRLIKYKEILMGALESENYVSFMEAAKNTLCPTGYK
jgi:hypothetical protein